jgi:hypothetical protein
MNVIECLPWAAVAGLIDDIEEGSAPAHLAGVLRV